MTAYFTELLSVTVALAMGFPILLYPLWENVGARTARPQTTNGRPYMPYVIYIVANAVIMCAGLYITRQFVTIGINNIQVFKLWMLAPQLIPALIMLRKRFWQVIFLIFTWLMYAPVQTGIGNYLAEMWFPENLLFWSSIISIAAIAATAPPLLYMLRRICRNPDAEHATTFWRLAWIVPATFYILTVAQGTYASGSGFGIWFISVRLVSYIMSLLVCYLFDTVIRQITEAKITQEENEILRARVEVMLKSAQQGPETITKGRLTLKTTPMIALIDGEDILLSKKEFALLLFFVRNEGSTVNPDYIYRQVWGQPMAGDANTVKASVSKLRKKLDGSGYTICAKRGKGYRFEKG